VLISGKTNNEKSRSVAIALTELGFFMVKTE